MDAPGPDPSTHLQTFVSSVSWCKCYPAWNAARVRHSNAECPFIASRFLEVENFLHALLDLRLLVVLLHLLARVVRAALVVLGQQGAEVELGRLQQLHLAHVDLWDMRQQEGQTLAQSRHTYVLQRVDALAGLLDLRAEHFGDDLLSQAGESLAGRLALHNLDHLLPYRADLSRACVGGLADLVLAALGEGDDEHAQEVVVGRLDDDVALDERLPLAHQRAQLVRREVEAVEVGQAVAALDLVDAELDLAEGVVLVILQVGERDLDDAALEGVVGVLETGRAVDESLADALESRVSLVTSSAMQQRGTVHHRRSSMRIMNPRGGLTLSSRNCWGRGRCTSPCARRGRRSSS